MGAVIQWVVITLAVIGAFGVVAAVWEDLAPRLRREKDAWDVDEDFESDDVRSAAAQLVSENEWWEMSLEGLEAQPAFQMSVSALADPHTDVTEVVSLSRDSDGWVASMALAALAQRNDVPAAGSRGRCGIPFAPRSAKTGSSCELSRSTQTDR